MRNSNGSPPIHSRRFVLDSVVVVVVIVVDEAGWLVDENKQLLVREGFLNLLPNFVAIGSPVVQKAVWGALLNIFAEGNFDCLIGVALTAFFS